MITLRKHTRQFASDVLALTTLAFVAWVIAGFLVRDEVFLYGDHPGHYWVMWYTLNVAAPLHYRLIDWIPYWYAGYPELQFTPPGYVILGWLLNLVTFGKLSTALIYESVAFTAYALPAFTFYYAVRHWGLPRSAAFAAGLFGLVFPAFFDGATALFIGMLGSRLAWALDALILAWGIDFLEARGWRFGWIAVFTLAAAILAHPYHAVGVMLALGLYVLLRRLSLLHASARLGIIVLSAGALDAFWLVPLFAHSSTAMIALVRSTFDQTWRLLADVSLAPYALLAVPVLSRARREQDAPRRAILVVLIMLPLILSVAMLAIHVLLIERLHIYQFDPVRLIGEVYFPLLLLAAIGASEISTWLAKTLRIPNSIAAGASALLLSIVFLIPLWQTSTYFHAKTNAEPRFLSQAITDYRLNELWETLRASPGRVWFTSFSTRLTARSVEPFPTTLAALTPLFSNRALMGGTYSHWSPIAALMWVGKINPPVLWGLSEEQDDRALFGIPLAELADDQLATYCQRLNVTTIVASLSDYHIRTFLDASPRFQSYYNNGFFFLYRLKGFDGAWLDAHNAVVDLTALADDRIDLRVRAAQSDASATVKVYAYPLWRAYAENGRPLQITRDDLALMRIALPPGENYSVTLRYEDGAVERPSNLVSILSLVLFIGSGAIAIGRRLSTARLMRDAIYS